MGADKVCSCSVSYTPADWRSLLLVGYQDDGVERLELRQCARCHSTMAVEVPGSGLLEEEEPMSDNPVRAREIVSTVCVFVDGWTAELMCNGRPIASWRLDQRVPGTQILGKEYAEACGRLLRLALLSPLVATTDKETT